MKLSFHGADRGVTGSCHLIEVAGCRIVVDCGLFQGSRELHEENAAAFGFDPAGVDFLLLSHAHLDHCGRLPLLVKQGFQGEIITTAASRELVRLVLLDAAHLQEEEARRRARVASRRGHGETKPAPLYSVLDALNSLDRFGRAAAYGEPVALRPGIRATFLDAGHILGSASILIEAEEQGRPRRVLYSGDLGNAGRPLLRPPVTPQAADIVVMETTYGDRLHRSLDASVEELYQAIEDAFARGGNVIVPTFALERAQEILFFLRQGIERNRLKPSMQVFLDSPMAISATAIFERHPECYEPDVAALFKEGRDPFSLPGLHLTRESAESMAINNIRGGALIMAGSGMCTGGRVRHHLRHNLSNPDATVIFVGYAAQGTLARLIIDGAKRVRLFDEEIAVRARVHTINGFSAHADQRELLDWHARIGGVTTTILVHGEEDAMGAFARHFGGRRVEMPRLHERLDF
ncbi:MAG TPA: MBL fold metallo-hydrolase [Stellaceae bacterium]|nr:MBL fold metallo-hydrolase [Stellaceae bacterium]